MIDNTPLSRNWYLAGFLKTLLTIFFFFFAPKTTVEPPCATTSRKRPPHISGHLSKYFRTQRFVVVESYSKRPPIVSDRDHIFMMTVLELPLFLTSSQRPPDTMVCSLCSLYVIRYSKYGKNFKKQHGFTYAKTKKLHANDSLQKVGLSTLLLVKDLVQ